MGGLTVTTFDYKMMSQKCREITRHDDSLWYTQFVIG